MMITTRAQPHWELEPTNRIVHDTQRPLTLAMFVLPILVS